MKTVNRICQILAVVLGLAALLMFCFTFAEFTMPDGTVAASGLQIAFGSELIDGVKIARSADVLFCFWLSVLSVVLGVFTFFSKSASLKYVLAGESLVSAIYMLVISLSNPWKFVDTRPLTANVKALSYGPFVIFAVVALFLTAFAAIAFMFISDYINVKSSKGDKKVLIKRVIQFFKDYKSETKKIVWPGIRDVLKNTLIVLIMCLVVGVIVWLVDLGLGSLLKAVW